MNNIKNPSTTLRSQGIIDHICKYQLITVLGV